MRFSTILFAILPASVFAVEHSLERRVDNAARIIADIKTINSDFIQLNKTLNSFPDSGPIPPTAEAQFESIGTKIRNDFQTLADDVKASTKVTKAEANMIINVTITFKNILAAVGKNIVAHKVAFDNAGLTASIVQALQSYESSVKMACASLKSLSPSTEKQRLQKVCMQIQMILQNTINGLQS